MEQEQENKRSAFNLYTTYMKSWYRRFMLRQTDLPDARELTYNQFAKALTNNLNETKKVLIDLGWSGKEIQSMVNDLFDSHYLQPEKLDPYLLEFVPKVEFKK